MKLLKNLALIWLIIAISSAVTNWGGTLTKDPVFVVIMLLLSLILYAVGEFWND